MTRDEFWAIIEASRATADPGRDGNQDRQLEQLHELLTPLGPTEILAFRHHFYTFAFSAHDWDLWAVAYIVGNGCSDDWFDYFCFWLVSLGRDSYEEALRCPDAMDRLFRESHSEDFFFERISYVPGRIYKSMTGLEPLSLGGGSSHFRGQPWNDGAEAIQRFPDLASKYLP